MHKQMNLVNGDQSAIDLAVHTAYHQHIPKSVPEEDYEGRMNLYKL